MKVRFAVIFFGIACCFLFLIGTLYHMQVMQQDLYTARANAQQRLRTDLIAERGAISISDKDGRSIPLAVNQDHQVIFAVPKEIEDAAEAAGQISELVDIPVDELITRFSKPGDQYEELIAKATDVQVASVEQQAVKGIYTTTRRARQYPFGRLASQVVGFVSQPDEAHPAVGQYGIEQYWDEALGGVAGQVQDDQTVIAPQPGREIKLTIDQNIEQRAEQILDDLVLSKGAIGGSVIVLEPSTGKVLAMANSPTFDPNNYAQSPLMTFTNPTVQGLYEPGSVFKPITMAIGIDTGAITPDTTYYDPGFFTADGKTIKNWDLKAHGTLTMTNVIEQSVNTGTVFAEKKIGHKKFYEYLLKFGIKELTGIELPGETTGRLTPLEKYPRDINFATASYGQGVAVTPIRLISALGAIANGGVLVEPYILEGAQLKTSRRVISTETAAQVTQMMVSAVQKAKVADLPQYAVAGKTGTAFKPDFQKGGYTDKVINTYIGFAPASKPRFIALIKLDEPKDAPLAGTTVVPAFRELAEFILNYYTVAPDRSGR